MTSKIKRRSQIVETMFGTLWVVYRDGVYDSTWPTKHQADARALVIEIDGCVE